MINALILTPVTPAVRALFNEDMPSVIRCWGVLDGILAGHIWTDGTVAPTWAVLQETTYGTLYFGGKPPKEIVQTLIAARRLAGEVILGVWQHDPLLGLIPTDYAYDGWAIDFTDRTLGTGLELFLNALPPGLALRPMDAALLARSMNSQGIPLALAEPSQVLEQVEGVFLTAQDEILAEAVSGPVIRGLAEMGIETYERHRRRGYATIASAALIQACETKGWQTYWNCAKQNAPSVALARKLGYRREQGYRVLAWT